MDNIKNNYNEFKHIISMISNAKERALLSINVELIKLYWEVGKYISNKIKNAEWGEEIVDNLADYISKTNHEIKGLNRRGLFRMRQFYDAYVNYSKVSPLVTQLNWSNNLLILSKTKSIEEKEFYILLTIKEKYSKRELERQIDSGYFERYMLSSNLSSTNKKNEDYKFENFKDTYVLEFLDLPENFNEKDLSDGLIKKFKN